MNEKFWQDRWASNQIAFHNAEPNPLLVEHWHSLSPMENSHVFVPLCGKSIDLIWLAQRECRVTGVELSELAVKQFFDELGVEPQVTAISTVKRYEGKGIVILQGSIFDVTSEMLGSVDFVYDRAALVALPPDMRERYATHLVKITGVAPQLLISYEYDQSCAEGPPFSVEEAEVLRLYEASFDMSLLKRSNVEGGLKGRCPAEEAVWRLRRW